MATCHLRTMHVDFLAGTSAIPHQAVQRASKNCARVSVGASEPSRRMILGEDAIPGLKIKMSPKSKDTHSRPGKKRIPHRLGPLKSPSRRLNPRTWPVG